MVPWIVQCCYRYLRTIYDSANGLCNFIYFTDDLPGSFPALFDTCKALTVHSLFGKPGNRVI